MRAFPLSVIALVLAGCAHTTMVQTAVDSKSSFDDAVYPGQTVELNVPTPGAPVFRVFQRGSSGFDTLENVRTGVEGVATSYCARRGATVRAVQERSSTPPHILGNIPRVEWLFECSTAAKPSSAPPADRVARLERLKKLLDSGALTQQEFEKEKAKVLGSP